MATATEALTLTTDANAGPIVQETSGSTTGTTLTLTLPSATTPGNGVIIATAGYYGGTLSNITLGGVGSIFTKQATCGGLNAEIWADLSVTQTSNTIVITTSAAGILAWAYEVNPNAGGTPGGAVGGYELTLFRTAGTTGTSTTFSSGATAATPVYGGTQLAIGLGLTVGAIGSAGSTITETATGWTNEAAITGVNAGSGSLHTIGGISGYETFGSSQPTVTYSGTTGTSENWGAVVATFILAPVQPGWGGLIFNEHPSYTGISATFTIPSLTGEAGSLASVWVGLGDVYQTGIYLVYDTTKTGNSNTSPWSWWIQGGGEIWHVASYPTKAGDSLTMSMQLTSTQWLMTLTNNTQGWTYTEAKSVLATNIGTDVWKFPITTAEVIIEKEGSDTTPDYGTITFTSVTTTPAIVSAPAYLITKNTSIDQLPGPLSAGSFTMNWTGYS